MTRLLRVAVCLLLCGCSGSVVHKSDDDPSVMPPDVIEPRDNGLDAAAADKLRAITEKLARKHRKTITEPAVGGDVSWPQCPEGMGIPEKQSKGLPMPLPDAAYVVLGLTNGPGFVANPCLADQVTWVADRKLPVAAYAVASFPSDEVIDEYADKGPFDGEDEFGSLANVGYRQARFNVRTMKKVGLVSPIVWIDVEPVPDFDWTTDLDANAAVIKGVARGYVDAGYNVGIYSTPSLWKRVVGDLQLQVPEWRAAGQTSREEALNRCGDDWSIQGGTAVMGQWVALQRDQNVTCPGIAADLGQWFHRFT